MMQRFSPEQIVDTVCKTLELDFDKFRSKIRETRYADGRFIAAYLIRLSHKEKVDNGHIPIETQYLKLTELFNRKRYTLHKEFRVCKQLLQNNKEFKRKCDSVYEALKAQA